MGYRNTIREQCTGRIVGLFGEVLADIFPDKQVLGGAPFNVARHLAAFNQHAVLITRVGDDQLKDELLNEMDWRGMDAIGVQQDPVYPTGKVEVTLDNGEPTYTILSEQAYDYIHAGMTHMITMSLKPELTYFGTLAQRNVKSRMALDQFLSDGKCPRFLDINLRKPWYNKHTLTRSLQRADIVKLNENELDLVAKTYSIEASDYPQKAIELLNKFDLRQVVVTCGAGGAWVLDAQNKLTIAVPPKNRKRIVDTVGAGDAFASVYILGLIESWDLMLTLQRANHFAAAICRIRGAVPDSLSFYIPFKKEWGI